MMHRLSRAGILITFGMLIISIIGSCADDDLTESTTESDEIKLLATTPDDGGTISINGELQMVFDGALGGVTVDGMRATIVADHIASMQIANLGEVTPGTKKTVTISWVNLDYSFVGTRTIRFTLTPAPATKVEVDPVPGSGILTETQFTLSFDQEVAAVWGNDIAAVGSGRNWRVVPYLPYGPVSLNIKWVNRDGSTDTVEVGPYDVYSHPQPVPAEITHGTVFDGEVDVDPAPINADGFRFDFDEPVTGTIKLTDEAGVDLNWIGNVAGTAATLTAVAGQELANETTYKIDINVQDSGGLRTEVTITFVTKPK